jgi:S1-C subfamily serine protease
MRLKLLVLLMLVSNVSLAQDVPPRVKEALQSVGLVTVGMNDGRTQHGSCVYLGDGLASTAWHVVSDSRVITVTWRNDMVQANVAYSDEHKDQAIIRLSRNPRVKAIKISEVTSKQLLEDGFQLFLSGFSRGTQQRTWEGRVLGMYWVEGHSDSKRLDISDSPIPGESGGAVLTCDGELVGCVSSSWRGMTQTSSPESLRHAVNASKKKVN